MIRKCLQNPVVLRILRAQLLRHIMSCGRNEPFRCRKAVFSLIHVQLIHRQLVMLTYDLRLLKIHFKAVGPRRISCGSDEHSGSSIRKLHICGHIVLYLDVMPLSFMHKASDTHRQAADPLQQIQLMRALIQEHAAPFSVPGRSPLPGIIVVLRPVPVRDDPVHSFDLSVFSALDQLMHADVNRIGPLIEHHRKRHFRMPVCAGNHLPHLLRIDTGRLLAHDVQMVLHRRNRQPRMLIMRNGNQNRIDLRILQKILPFFVNLHLCRKVFSGPRSPVLFPIRHGRQLHSADIPLGNALCMAGSHISDSDNSDFYNLFTHNRFLLASS